MAIEELSAGQEGVKGPKGGRPRIFEEPTARLNLFLPKDTAVLIRMLALQSGVSPSQLVDAWARRMGVLEAIARGREDFEKGHVSSHDEAMKRLAKW